jgi:type II secretory pathway component GspD/PulD (secretin)
MKCASGIVALTLSVFVSGSGALAQKTPAEVRQARQDIEQNPSVDNIRIYYLKSAAQASDANELYTALRNMLPADVKSYLVPSQNAIIVLGTPDQFAIVDKLLNDLDHPRKTYRLSYTVTDMDGARRIGSQQFSLVATSGQQAVLKQGSKNPVATGSFSAAATTGANAAPAGTQTNFTYLDVGMNFDATPTSVGDGISLRTSVEQLGISDQRSGVGLQDPIVKQSSVKSTLLMPLGKPVMLGSIDLPGTTHHLDIEVTAEQLP